MRNKFIGNLLKTVAIAVIFLSVLVIKSYAAESIDPLNLDNLIFDNTQGSDNSQNAGEENKANEEAEKQAAEAAEAAKKASNSSSKSDTQMPATGSNAEIIFSVGAVVLVGGAVFMYKKQNIKIK